MADDDRERREAHAYELLNKCLPYDKVGAEGRMRAIHNELVFSIDRAITAQRPDCRFNDSEIEVIRSVALQIVLLLDSTNRPRRGFVRGVWAEFLAQPRLNKMGIISTIVGSLIAGGWALYHELKPPEPTKMEIVNPKPITPIPTAPSPPTTPKSK
jgi:hypothetical protein